MHLLKFSNPLRIQDWFGRRKLDGIDLFTDQVRSEGRGLVVGSHEVIKLSGLAGGGKTQK